MPAIVLSAVVACIGALLIGQALLRACGVERWSWLSAPVGLAAQLLVAVPALHLPGRASTTAGLLAVLVLASAVRVLRDPALRPPIGGLLAAAPVAALTLLPFAAAGRGGTLGVTLNNDMAFHLRFAEVYRSAEVARVVGIEPNYPVGPHALVAAIAQALGERADLVFAGLTAAGPILLAWTALGLLGGRVRWPGQVAAATVGGMPFLVAAYYGQGSFKEPLQALFVLGLVVALVDRGPRGPLRWAPLALIAAGAVSVYSFAGLAWSAGVLAVALPVAAVRAAARRSPRALLAGLRGALAPAAIATAVLALVIAPQISRVWSFFSGALAANGRVVPTTDLGNLAGPLPLWEAFGAWGDADYRLPVSDELTAGVWTAFVAALAALGVVWCIRRREWALPLTALVALALWVVSDRTQSPYIAAKALVIMAPLLLLLAIRPLVERDGAGPRWWRVAAPLLAVVLVVKVVDSSVRALAASPVGPTAHADELRALRPLLRGQPALFLGNDDFVMWELSGVPVQAPVISYRRLPLNPAKRTREGHAFDVDTVGADAINAAAWVITTRDAAGSVMPPQLRLVRRTRSFALWRRGGTVRPRHVLAEGDAGGAMLRCSTAAGRRIARGGGVALIRPSSIGVPAPPFRAGTSIGVELRLAPGEYDLATPYVSPQPIDLRVVGHLDARLPANLDRAGPRWPIGRIAIPAGRPRIVRVGMYARRTRLTPSSVLARPGSVVATPVGGKRVVPIRRACGKLVDWYEPAAR